MKKKEKRCGFTWKKACRCLAVLALTAALVSGEGLATLAKESMTRYSDICDSEEELPEPVEHWTDEKGGQWQLKESRVLAVPLTGRKRNLSGEVVYPEVTRRAEIPSTAVMDVTDEESGQVITVELPLSQTEYRKERWQQDLEFTVTFHSYGVQSYRLGDVSVPHHAEQPPLEVCRSELHQQIGLTEEDCRMEAFAWDGEAYPDADGTLCRDAKVTGARRVWDCRAVYAGEAALPDVIRYRMQMEYEPVEEDAASGSEADDSRIMEMDDEGSGADAGSDGVAEPLWQRLLRRGLMVSLSLVLLFFMVLGFRKLRKYAEKLDEGNN